MPDYAVGTVFTAKDKVSPVYKKMGKSADKFGQRTSSAFRNATKEGYRFGTVVKGILAANIIRGGIARITQGLGSAVRQFAEFDDIAVGATARFKDITGYATDFNAQVEITGRKVRDLAKVSRFMPVEVMRGLNEMAKAEYIRPEAFAAMTPMMNLAKATQTDLNATIGHTIDIMSAYGLREGDLETRIKNQNRVTDVLTASTLGARLELEDMQETMKYVGPIASNMGWSFEEAAANSVFLARAGMRATVGATQLKNALLKLVSPKLRAELEDQGVKIEKVGGGMRRFADILRDINLKMDISGISELDKASEFSRMFGLRAITGALHIGSAADAVNAFGESLLHVDGVTKNIGDRVEESLLSRFLRLNSALLELGFRFLDAFKTKGKAALDVVIDAVNRFKVQPLIDSVNLLITMLRALWNTAKPFLPYIHEIVAGFIAFKVATKALPLIKLAVAFRKLAMAEGILTAATGLFNGTLLLCPLFWIPAAIALVVVGIVYLERKFKLFSTAFVYWKKAFSDWWKTLKSMFDWIVNSKAFQIIKTVIGAPMALAKTIGGVGKGSAAGVPESWLAQGKQAPNEQDAKTNKSSFNGMLTINAPTDASFVTYKKAPGFNVELLGANP